MYENTDLATAGCGCLIVPAFIVAWVALMSGILMLLWNWIAVGLFHAPVINFWQAVGLSILMNIIGSAFRSGGSK